MLYIRAPQSMNSVHSHAAVSWDGTGKGMSRKEHREAREDECQKRLFAKGHRQALSALCSLHCLWRVPLRSRANRSVEGTAAPIVKLTAEATAWRGFCASSVRSVRDTSQRLPRRAPRWPEGPGHASPGQASLWASVALGQLPHATSEPCRGDTGSRLFTARRPSHGLSCALWG